MTDPATPSDRPEPGELVRLLREAVGLLADVVAHYETARLGPPAAPRSLCRPKDVADYLAPELGDLAQEQLRVVNLDVKNHILGAALVYQGGINAVNVRTADVFREAVRLGAASIIVAHNHPSQDPTPSPEDVACTVDLVRAGALLGIAVLDHVIVTKREFTSLRERGLGFPLSPPSGAARGFSADRSPV